MKALKFLKFRLRERLAEKCFALAHAIGGDGPMERMYHRYRPGQSQNTYWEQEQCELLEMIQEAQDEGRSGDDLF
mgnify:CR=1 FL=1